MHSCTFWVGNRFLDGFILGTCIILFIHYLFLQADNSENIDQNTNIINWTLISLKTSHTVFAFKIEFNGPLSSRPFLFNFDCLFFQLSGHLLSRNIKRCDLRSKVSSARTCFLNWHWLRDSYFTLASCFSCRLAIVSRQLRIFAFTVSTF